MKYSKVLSIAHRVCPRLSGGAVGFTSKEEMVRATTRSLSVALSRFNGKVRLFIILDGCPSYRTFISQSFANCANVEMEFEETPAIGNAATYARQCEMLRREASSDYVYFSEDDYVYHEDAFAAMADFLDWHGDFVTPLDHPDRYVNGTDNNAGNTNKASDLQKEAICVSKFRHWRTAANTCCTFMTTFRVLNEAYRIISSYGRGTSDYTMWEGLTKRLVLRPSKVIPPFLAYLLRMERPYEYYMPVCVWKYCGLDLLRTPKYTLWQPIRTLAVHLARKSISPHSEEILRPYVPLEQRNVVNDIGARYVFGDG